MITTTVDIGQIFIVTMIGLVGYFIKLEITRVGARLDKHETIITALVGEVQRVVGYQMAIRDSRREYKVREGDPS